MTITRCPSCQGHAPGGAWFCPSCGAALPSPDPTLIDGRFRLAEELGRGAMGVVYAAHDVELDRPVAVKMINPVLTRSSSTVAQLRSEARALATVRSDHVVRVYSFGTHGGRSFFAMERVLGSSLATIIDEHHGRGRFIQLSRALTFLEQLARGLDAVHAAGLVHRDVKPANVLVESHSDRPVLVDFGLALSALTRSGEILPAGTPSYMAPEQIAGERVGPSSDVYAFACSAFEVLTSQVPFPGVDLDEVFRCQMLVDAPPPSRSRAELRPADRVFARALAKNPRHRQQTCTELAGELADALGSALRAPMGSGAAEPQRRGPLVLLVEPDAAFARACARAIGLALFGIDPRVIVAASGAEARLRLGADTPDVVLLDGALAHGGEALVSQLRERPGGESVSFIAIGGAGGPGSGPRLGPSTAAFSRTLAFPDLLRDLSEALVAAGIETSAAPDGARSPDPTAPPRSRRRTG